MKCKFSKKAVSKKSEYIFTMFLPLLSLQFLILISELFPITVRIFLNNLLRTPESRNMLMYDGIEISKKLLPKVQ